MHYCNMNKNKSVIINDKGKERVRVIAANSANRKTDVCRMCDSELFEALPLGGVFSK